MDLDMLSQVWDAGNFHYYVNELCRLKDGKFAIPIHWLEKVHMDGIKAYHANAFALSFDTEVRFLWSLPVALANVLRQYVATIVDSDVILINAVDLEANYFNLEFGEQLPKWSGM